MGFSLQMFFEELIQTLESMEASETDIQELLSVVQEQESYAKECGAIPND